MSAVLRLEIPEEVLEIARELEAAGHEAWCVGGALRDALLGHPHTDYDFATSATPAQVTALFRRTAPVGEKYGTVGVLDRRRVLHEVTTFRRDVVTDGRHAVVAYGVSLDEDLARRDFTVNAIAYHPLRHEWRDPFDGRGDLDRAAAPGGRRAGRAVPRGLPPHPPGAALRGPIRVHHRARHLGRGRRGSARAGAALRRAGPGRMVQGAAHGADGARTGEALARRPRRRALDARAGVGARPAPGGRRRRAARGARPGPADGAAPG